ncbi:cytochrome P450 [Nonomuraea roseoviolacea]|uniref:Cytochrome P450 n=1 Tax=Nonomuraea roseoviolacea subsp. carminata TaxID=160689 RepID=A0ABT1KE14_9ACTN|nr:cytochrome P450 [Nonomuraea roseoviolacea]MCP2351912.1 cytochrome P450 [Nonomuraea roseoviolacea subsp. carminata]
MTKSVTVPQLPVERGCPFATPAGHDRLREQAPISRVRLMDGAEGWLVSGHEEARAVLADRRFSSDRRKDGFPFVLADPQTQRQLRAQPPLMVGMDGAEHAAARRPVVGEFTVKRLAALRPRIQDIVDHFVDDLLAADRRPVDLVRALSLPVPSLVICELLGVPYTDHDFFQSRTAVAVSRTSSSQERLGALAELRAFMDELVTRKESEPGDDLLSRQIARQRQDGALDHAGLVSLAFLLLTAGHETTANMISLGVVALLTHPQQLDLITTDPGKTPLAVEELLRFFSIADLVTSRVATEDVRIGEAVIRAGEGVVVSGLSADRDPAAFADPARLDVERGARHHLAFGFGPHQCLGQNLARLELQIVFDTLFRRVPTLRLAAPVEELPFKSDAVIYGLHELPVTW